MDQLFGEYIPIWSWPPVLVGLFILLLDFGTVMLIRKIKEGKWYFTRWKTFQIGDTVGLPVYAGFAAVVIADHDFSGIYTQWWWHLAILLGGFALWDQAERMDLKSGLKTQQDLDVPSERYHTFVFRPMFYMMASVLIPLIAAAEANWQTAAAFSGLAIYLACFIYDQIWGDHETPYSADKQ